MAERVLSAIELNRALLARQMLLERARTPLPRALERMAGLQAQYAPSMYIGLWSRVEDFERAALTRALGRGSVIQATLMRATIHLVSCRDYWPFELGIKRARRDWFLRVGRDTVGRSQLSAAARKLRPRLEAGPMSRLEIEELLGKPLARVVGMELDLVRVPPGGTWERRRADVYAAAEDWLGPPSVDEQEGIELLVRRYLGGFGPATVAELADWAGLAVKAVAPAVERIATRRFRSEDGAELVDLPRAPLPDPETPAPVRFLPTWDATLLAHARRTRVLPEENRPRIFNTKMPQSVPTFMVDGAVAGTWRYEDGSVRMSPFGRLDRATRSALGEEAERLAAFHAG